MAKTSQQKADTFPDLKKKRDDLTKSLSEWEEIKEPGKTIQDPERDAALERINKLLGLIKSEINVYWGPGRNDDHEVRILIADKRSNPVDKQVEDIEGDVHRMEGF